MKKAIKRQLTTIRSWMAILLLAAIRDPLFNSAWYKKQPAAHGHRIWIPVVHYLRVGAKRGFDPNPLFDSDWYLAEYNDVAEAKMNPLYHFVRWGCSQWRDPNPVFDTDWYGHVNHGVGRAKGNALRHYLKWGQATNKDTHPLLRCKSVPKVPTAIGTVASQSWIPHDSAGDKKQITILIPVYGKWHYTERCLRALAQTEAVEMARIIVIDDQSPDDTAQRINAYPWVECFHLEKNLGFTRACNAGAQLVDTEFLCFLNNDTEPLPGFLSYLMSSMISDPTIAIAGSRLLYGNGKLQEAGSIIWSDGTGHNFGRGLGADAPQCLVGRNVDYCSAASVLVRTDFFRMIGGFDERYAPAYYEDTDLAFEAHQRGYKVLYEPRSVVIHHEGGTHGTDISEGGKAQQEINRKVFCEKWKNELQSQWSPNEVAPRVAITHRSDLRPSILYFDHRFITPDQDSGSYRAFQLLKICQSLGYTVVFATADENRYSESVDMLHANGIETLSGVQEVSEYLSEGSLWVEAAIIARAEPAHFWVNWFKSHSPETPIIFDTVDIHHLRESQQAQLTGNELRRLRSQRTERIEIDLVSRSFMTLVVGGTEKQYLLSKVPNSKVHVVSNIHPLSDEVHGLKFTERHGLLFVGGFEHYPNVDGILWFLDEVWPLVDSQIRSDGLIIIGSKMPESIKNRASENVQVEGWVDSTTPYLNTARLSIAPLRFGAGVKGKVGEAWASGLPVIGTSVALADMMTEPQTDLVTGDSPTEFAGRINRVYFNEALWNTAKLDGRNAIVERFSVDVARKELEKIFEIVSQDSGLKTQ